jgi:hypothetical protein
MILKAFGCQTKALAKQAMKAFSFAESLIK